MPPSTSPEFVLPAPPVPSVAVFGTTARFPVRRIFCVGRNYAAHAREMGSDPTREAPFFFCKPADAVVDTGTTIPYPPETKNLHHEIELVVAIGKAGADIPREQALDHIFGYGVGVDLTRRDLQNAAKDKGRPWDWGKGFDRSAPIAPLRRVSEIGHIAFARIWLAVNATLRQEADIADMIWPVADIISIASRSMELRPGDLIMTGTPGNVGPLIGGRHRHWRRDRPSRNRDRGSGAEMTGGLGGPARFPQSFFWSNLHSHSSGARMAAFLRWLLAATATLGPCAAQPPPRTVLIAGDGSLDVFDNAVSAMAGRLPPETQITRLSASTQAMHAHHLRSATLSHVLGAIATMHPAPGQGCLVFATSHGVDREGLYLSPRDEVLSAPALDNALALGCGQAPTIVVISSCFSGVFARPPMTRDNRIVLTAARPDRTSFGCHAGRTYTVYDQCLLTGMDHTSTWNQLYVSVRSCVDAEERRENVTPSEPQAWFGFELGTAPLPTRAGGS